MTWFYFICGLSLTILISDARGTLEPTIKKWEKKLGIPVYHAPVDSMESDINNPYPIQDTMQQDTFNNQRENNGD